MNQRLFWADAPHTYDYQGEVYPTILFISEKIPCDQGLLHLKIEKMDNAVFQNNDIVLYLTTKEGLCREIDAGFPSDSLTPEEAKREAEILLFSHIDSNGKFIERPNR